MTWRPEDAYKKAISDRQSSLACNGYVSNAGAIRKKQTACPMVEHGVNGHLPQPPPKEQKEWHCRNTLNLTNPQLLLRRLGYTFLY